MSTTNPNRPPSGAYVIVLRDYLVSQDLAETVAEYAPGAEVILHHTPAAAAAAVTSLEKIEVAFVEQEPEAFAASGLARLIDARGGRVVLMGSAAEAAGAKNGWPVLHRPFALQQVLLHLAGRCSH